MTAASGRTRTTCPYCGVGCGVIARHAGERLLEVAGDPSHPANRSRLCVKGVMLPDTQQAAGRLLEPVLHGTAVSWSEALDRIAAELASAVACHGPQAVAMYLSGQLLTEDYYVANKLMKGFIGSANVDTNSRLCMASAVAAHQRAFGEDVVPCDYDDLEHCELVVLVGSNAAWAHPVLFERVRARHERGDLRVVVVDPRRTATGEVADLHLALRPGSDAALFNALLAHLADAGAIDRGWVDRHTEGFQGALAAARADAPRVEQVTGLPVDSLTTFFRWFAGAPRTVTLFSQGVNQAGNGTDRASAIINCHLATGRIGKRGAGPFSITGQPNAMGGRETGGMANQLAAHMGFDPADVERVRRFWNGARMAERPGLKAVDLFRAVASGEVRAIWIIGTNPAVSLPQADSVRRALRECPFVVVSDCVRHTDTIACADLLLPALGWGEKDGTVTNSERRISRQRAFLPPPGSARPDWWAVCQVAARLGHRAAFRYRHPAEIFREHAALSGFENAGRRLFDISALAALSDADYDLLPPVQWPLPAAAAPVRPFADGRFVTGSGRAQLVAVRHRAPVQQPDTARPFVLNTGRLRDQWHTMTRTGTSPRLFGHTDMPSVHLNRDDARRLHIGAGDLLELANGHGLVRGVAVPSSGVAAGQVFFPMHWSDAFAHPARVGALIEAVVDPWSGQPESKHGRVAVVARSGVHWIRLVSFEPLPGTLLERLLLWVRLPGERGWRYELATDSSDAADMWLARLERSLHAATAVARSDSAGSRRLLLQNPDGGSLVTAAVAQRRTELPSAELLAAVLAEEPERARRRLLAGPGGPGQTESATVCTCFRVSRSTIRAALDAGAGTVAELGRRLGCGTGCGSCVPELGSLVAEHAALRQT